MRLKAFFVFAILLLPFAACNKQASELTCIFTENVDKLQEGDLVFRRGMGTASYLVYLADKRGIYSHVGILLKDSCGWMVIHSVPEEQDETNGMEIMKKDSLNLFFRSDRAIEGAVFRLETNNGQITSTVAEESRKLLAQNIYFDHSFNTEDNTKMYCTELIYFIYKQARVDITEGRRHQIPGFRYEVILPIDILENKNLVEIYKF